jgi:hypothetical protein
MIGLELVRNTIPGIDIKKTIVDDILPGPYFNHDTLPILLEGMVSIRVEQVFHLAVLNSCIFPGQTNV